MGAVGGLQGGYNYQFAPAWVVGVEGDISWASLSDHRTATPLLRPTGLAAPGLSIAMSANTNWLASARGKLGFTGWFNNTMLYVTGGGAWTSVEYTGTSIFTTPFASNTSFNTTKSGWVVGGGAEWQATTNILLRAEYLYYNFNSSQSAAANLNPAPPGEPLPIQTHNWVGYNVQVARVAASYKF
jgi:outer membrane immunogenic protein